MLPSILTTPPPDGVNLIEASAGTGKTWTISGLYLRLVVERRLPVEEILVVTFTKAATAELRERIRARLVLARVGFAEGRSDDPLVGRLLAEAIDPREVWRRLNLAVLDFDRAAIFTIHGFCQRVLMEGAFEGGRRFEAEMLSDQEGLLQECADDFWRQRVQDLPAPLLDYLARCGDSPEGLLNAVRGGIGRPWLEVRGRVFPEDLEGAGEGFEHAFGKAQAIWEGEAAEIRALFLAADGLSGSKYAAKSRPGWLGQMAFCMGEGPGPLFERFEKFTTATLAVSVNKGKTPPRHRFFDACEEVVAARTSLDEGLAAARIALLGELLAFLDRELGLRKGRDAQLHFDDLLLQLDAALGGEGGARLVAAVRGRYRAALIDEFQDTDPLQYRIFRRIWGEGGLPLFLVGDPKQAIYSFRGADIFAYLDARDDATATHSLSVNWRSVPGVLAGLNALFAGERPFLFDQIPFEPAQAAPSPRPPLTEGGEAGGEFRVWFLDGGDKPLAKGEAEADAARATAGEIARLLNGGAAGEIRIGDRPLSGGDIAVLVRKHSQGELVRGELLALGIHSVQRSQALVFRSAEAAELERLLLAVADPGREPLLRGALCSDLFGYDGAAIHRLSSDEQALEREVEAFREYHRLWRERGFIALFRHLQDERRIAPRLLALPDGERRLTNLLHLAELLHREEVARRPGLEGLLKWLSRARRGEGEAGEEAQLRLESDQNLVQIVTIHKSKGLQYPVVFVPFAWDGALGPRGGVFQFHDPKQGHRAVLELGSERVVEAILQARREEAAEDLRLLYVALTRAEQRCYLVWGNINQAGSSPLGWLLHRDEGDYSMEAMRERVKGLQGAGLRARLEEVARGTPGMQVEELCREAAEPFRGTGETLRLGEVRRLDRRIEEPRRITSFTGLVGPLASGGAERPDHDAGMEPAPGEVPVPVGRTIFDFPRGGHPGSCLHAIFERLDFTGHSAEQRRQLVESTLKGYGFGLEWTAVVEWMVRQSLAAPLDAGGLRLGLIPAGRRFVELEFYYPLRGLRLDALKRLLRAHGYGEGPFAEPLARLGGGELEGFMKGFIDLVFEADGRWYIVDYKSNWLGDHPEAYAPARLQGAVAAGHYFLQYLIYTLAIHRYLRSRIPDYDYGRHFGGVFYLFLRGIDPEAAPGCGIHRDLPPRGLIEGLDRLVAGGA